MQKLHWEIPARLRGTAKLKTSSMVADRQVKETQSKKGGHTKNKRIVPDDTHVNINLVFVLKKKGKKNINNYFRIERRKR